MAAHYIGIAVGDAKHELHMTVAFNKAMDAATIEKVKVELERVAPSLLPLTLTLDTKPTMFGDNNDIRVLLVTEIDPAKRAILERLHKEFANEGRGKQTLHVSTHKLSVATHAELEGATLTGGEIYLSTVGRAARYVHRVGPITLH